MLKSLFLVFLGYNFVTIRSTDKQSLFLELTDSNLFGLYYVIFSSKAILIYKIILKIIIFMQNLYFSNSFLIKALHLYICLNQGFSIIIIIFSCSLDLVLKIFENIFSTSLKVRHSNQSNMQQQKIEENKKASR